MSKIKWEVKKIIKDINNKEESLLSIKESVTSSTNELIEAIDRTIGFKQENTNELMKIFRSLESRESKEVLYKKLIDEGILENFL